MTSKSLHVHKSHSESREKFEYFILALVVAVLAYLGKDIQYERVGFNVSTVYLISMAVFSISAIAGFKRIEYSIEHQRLNYVELNASEKGDNAGMVEASQLSDLVARRALISYQVRNVCLIMGFICFITAKLLNAYINV